MLDVNAGIPLVDEPELLKAMIRTAQDAVDVPLCIDSSVIEALEAGLSVYEGRALVNSVTAEDERLEEILPLVARHGAAVIGLANDETGIPETPQKRLECARKIVSAAGDHGIAAADVIIDPLAMTVGADTEAVTITLETIRLIRDELGVNMCLGASNVSFGLPQRHVLNAAFLPMAMAAGLTSAIMSTAEVCVESVRAADLLLGHDPWGASWIAAHRARQAAGGRSRRKRRVSPQRLPRERAGARRSTPPEDGATGSGCASCPTAARSACPAARRSSTPRAGTGSRSTRPAAATARARSARCASSPARCRSSAVDPRAFTAEELRDGWRLACRAGAREDLVVEVPPLQTRPKAALVGVGRHVILRPSVQKRHLVLEEPTMEDQRSDLQRVLDGLDDLEPYASLELLRELGGTLRTAALRRHRGRLRPRADRPRARRHDRAALRDRLRPRHDDGRRHPARPRHRPAGRGALDAQPPAALRRRRDHPDLGDDDGRRRAGGAARPRPRDAGRARPARSAPRPRSPPRRSTRSPSAAT